MKNYQHDDLLIKYQHVRSERTASMTDLHGNFIQSFGLQCNFLKKILNSRMKKRKKNS